MQLKISNRIISKYSSIAVSLRYDSVASSCSASVYFDPANSDDRKLFIPGNNLPFQLLNGNEVLITGVLLNNKFKSAPTKQLASIGGYSKAGVLDDCQNPTTNYPLQFDGLSLEQIAKKLVTPFGLTVTVAQVVQSDATMVYSYSQQMQPDDTVKGFLTKLAIQKNIILSHDTLGNLLLTRADTKQAPFYDFNDGMPATDISLDYDGQQLHSPITALGQAQIGTSNSSEDTIINPYVQTHLDFMENARLNTIGSPTIAYGTGFRPKVSVQTSGNDNDTKLTARQLLSQELKSAIRLTINIDRWTLNNKLVRPNSIITVTSPENFLYQKSRWFVESVDFRGNEKAQTAVLNCVLPECYNNDTVVNVFTGSNLTVPYTSQEKTKFDERYIQV